MLLTAFFVRGFSFFCYAYPTGTDYGHHTFYADQYLATGQFPETFPFYQLGASRWSNLPGGALVYALVAAIAGRTAFELSAVTAFFGVVEVAGIYLLALRVLRRPDLALTAAVVGVFFPAGALMVAWSAFANIVAVALIPYALVAWLDYWHDPSPGRGLVAVVVITGITSIHHVSTAWLGLTLVLFGAVVLVAERSTALAKLWPVVLGGCILGLPVLLRIVELAALFSSGGPGAGGGERFASTRIEWSYWLQVTSVFSLVFLCGGLGPFLGGGAPFAHRLLIGCYVAVSLLFGFGWVFGLDFYYVRALYFLAVPSAMGAAALFGALRSASLRLVAGSAVFTAMGMGTLVESEGAARYYEALTPEVVEAADWLRDFSQPEDVVVVGGSLGYHMPRLLQRPTMVALTPELAGNPDDLAVARDALSILAGSEGMEDALERRQVRFIWVRARNGDVPDPARSRAVLDPHPRLQLVFQNADVLIYGVVPL